MVVMVLVAVLVHIPGAAVTGSGSEWWAGCCLISNLLEDRCVRLSGGATRGLWQRGSREFGKELWGKTFGNMMRTFRNLEGK